MIQLILLIILIDLSANLASDLILSLFDKRIYIIAWRSIKSLCRRIRLGRQNPMKELEKALKGLEIRQREMGLIRVRIDEHKSR